MTTFWDTSAIINACLNPTVLSRLESGRHISRPHTLAEFFSIMTGRGIRWQDDQGQTILVSLTPDDAAAWLKQFAVKLEWLDLDAPEVLIALSKAQSLGIQGGRVYDYIHAEAARKGEADKFLTRNPNDFQALTGKATLEWP